MSELTNPYGWLYLWLLYRRIASLNHLNVKLTYLCVYKKTVHTCVCTYTAAGRFFCTVCNSATAFTYVHTVSPLTNSQPSCNHLARATCESSIVRAWQVVGSTSRWLVALAAGGSGELPALSETEWEGEGGGASRWGGGGGLSELYHIQTRGGGGGGGGWQGFCRL